MKAGFVRRLSPIGLEAADAKLLELGTSGLRCTEASLVRWAIRYFLICGPAEIVGRDLSELLRRDYGDLNVGPSVARYEATRRLAQVQSGSDGNGGA